MLYLKHTKKNVLLQQGTATLLPCTVSNLYMDLHFSQVNYFQRFPCGSVEKESAFIAGNLGLFPGLGRYPGEGRGYPLQYAGLEICKAHGVAKNPT